MPKVRVNDVMEKFHLELISGEEGVHKPILTDDLYRPGIELTGFLKYYPSDRVQLLGKTELTFFDTLPSEEKSKIANELCAEEVPAIIITRNLDVPTELIEASQKNNVALLRSKFHTTRLISHVTNYLESKLAPTTAIHGVLVDVYGVGVVITGNSGVGKSETALELVKRGHRLVADDSVEIRQEGENTLIGTSPELIEHLLEIRGLGIINVMTLFGAGAVRNHKRITLNIHLESWEAGKYYDRLGLDEEKLRILDADITKLVIPVRPGRNIAVIIEVAAMNFRLKQMGMNAAQQFANKLQSAIATGHDEE